MEYLAGSVNGPIVWDQVQIGGYTIQNQALGQSISDSYNYFIHKFYSCSNDRRQ